FHVTGVQTCALPIYVPSRRVGQASYRLGGVFVLEDDEGRVVFDQLPVLEEDRGHRACLSRFDRVEELHHLDKGYHVFGFDLLARSEERRVGRETRGT